VPAGVLVGVDYVALGHLHGAQRVGAVDARPVIRYSGSPLAFSFGERGHVKSSALVTLAADGGVTVETVPTPVPRPLVEFDDTIDRLLDGRYDDHVGAWSRITATDAVHPDRLYARVRERFPHALAIHHVPVGAVDEPALRAVTVETDPVEVAADFVAFASGAPADELELDIVRSAYEAARATESSE